MLAEENMPSASLPAACAQFGLPLPAGIHKSMEEDKEMLGVPP